MSHYVAYIEKYDLDIVIPRLCRTFTTMLLSDTKASSQFILNAVEQKDIILKSEGNQYFSYIYVGMLFLLFFICYLKVKRRGIQRFFRKF